MKYSFRTILLLLLASLLIITACSEQRAMPAPEFTKDFPPPAGRALTIEDYYAVKGIGSVGLSPDGKWASFTIIERAEKDNSNLIDAWIVPTDGSASPQKVVRQGETAANPEWTRDGLLKYRSRESTWFLDVNSPGSRPFKDEGREFDGDLSPDGKWIAVEKEIPFPQDEPEYASDFERMHEERFEGKIFDWMYFQRDRQKFPVDDPRIQPSVEIELKNTGTGELTQLTSLGLRARGIEWHPKSTALLFIADSHFRDEMTYGRPDLWTVTLDGEVNRLTDDGYTYSSARFSPDGEHISYVQRMGTDMIIAQKLNHGGSTDIFISNPDGSDLQNITANFDLDPRNPVWSPDGMHIYFTAGFGGTIHLFRAAVDGSVVEQVTGGERRIYNLRIDDDFSTIIYTVGMIEKPAELYSARIDGTEEKQLTSVYDDLVSEITFSRAEQLRFASYDGTPLEGWLLYPYGYSPDKGPYPLIVNSHGGPHSASGYSFNFKQQYFAARGYFVLQTNFRSSTGYGDDFKWATWGEWGTKDGEDVMSGIDFVLEHFPIDGNRVGTTGHSYGGFMTNWLITQYSDRFAAAVCGAGISNWISDYGTADVARTKETEFFGTPWMKESRMRLLKQSPLIYAGNVRTPTLFIHGELDHRVPFEEAEQMYFAIKKQGVPSKMIQYARQSHGIRGHWNNIHRIINETRWWDQYLKD